MADRTVLFLDIASVTGWCEGEPGGKPTYGTKRLAPVGADTPEVAAGMIVFLGHRLQAFVPRLLVYEAPFMPATMNRNTTRLTFGLSMIAEGVAYRMGVRTIREANLNSIRKGMMGFVPRGKGTDVKRAVTDHVRSLGYDPQDDNAADAILGWLYACSLIDQRAGVETAPLFAGR